MGGWLRYLRFWGFCAIVLLERSCSWAAVRTSSTLCLTSLEGDPEISADPSSEVDGLNGLFPQLEYTKSKLKWDSQREIIYTETLFRDLWDSGIKIRQLNRDGSILEWVKISGNSKTAFETDYFPQINTGYCSAIRTKIIKAIRHQNPEALRENLRKCRNPEAFIQSYPDIISVFYREVMIFKNTPLEEYAMSTGPRMIFGNSHSRHKGHITYDRNSILDCYRKMLDILIEFGYERVFDQDILDHQLFELDTEEDSES